MSAQLDRLRAAHRYSSGSARREIARQIAEVEECERAIVEETTVPKRWCGWCDETLPADLAGDFCNETCQAEMAAAAEPHSAPLANESPTPSNIASNPEPLTSAPPPARGNATIGHAWWAAEGRLDRLRDLWEVEKLSTARIATALGCTKNAVIGQIHRSNKLMPRRETVVAPPVRPSPFNALGPAECCWPHGDPGTPGFHFCGVAAIAGKPYCQAHHDVAHLKATGREWTEERREKFSALLKQRGALPMRGGGQSR